MQKVATTIVTGIMYIAAIGLAGLIAGVIWYGALSIWNLIF